MTLGAGAPVLPADRELIGTAVDVDRQGRLLVAADGGTTTAIAAAGDVTHLRGFSTFGAELTVVARGCTYARGHGISWTQPGTR